MTVGSASSRMPRRRREMNTTRDPCTLLGGTCLLLDDRCEYQRLVRRSEREIRHSPRPCRFEIGGHRIERTAHELHVPGTGGKVIGFGEEAPLGMESGAPQSSHHVLIRYIVQRMHQHIGAGEAAAKLAERPSFDDREGMLNDPSGDELVEQPLGSQPGLQGVLAGLDPARRAAPPRLQLEAPAPIRSIQPPAGPAQLVRSSSQPLRHRQTALSRYGADAPSCVAENQSARALQPRPGRRAQSPQGRISARASIVEPVPASRAHRLRRRWGVGLARLRLGPTRHARRLFLARACRAPPTRRSLGPSRRKPLPETWLNWKDRRGSRRLARLRLGPTRHARRLFLARACRAPPTRRSLGPSRRKPLPET